MTQTLPLIIDLDDTLLLTDVLAEGVVEACLRSPVAAVGTLRELGSGRPAFKRAIRDIADVDLDALPIRTKLVDYLETQKVAGRTIHLVTASDQTVAKKVAARFGDLFDSVHGSTGIVNLKGRNKQAFLREHFADGYVYAGDSSADLAVWADADGIILAGASKAVTRAAERLGKPIEARFETESSPFKTWRKALRLHQWAKNLLIFAPLFLSGLYVSPNAWLLTITAFILVGIAASGTYLLNDLLDLSADRRHATKSARPLASGALSVVQGFLAAPVMIFGALLGATLLSPSFALGLLTYLILTLAYSFGLKRVAMVDVSILACLFTLRIAMGAFVVAALPSEWLLTFSLFFFLSLSLAKRHVEVAVATPGEKIRGRGYYAEDAPLTLVLGLSTASAAIVILVLYLAEEAFPSGQYTTPEWLWLAPGLIGLWLMRIWLLAHRGQLDDDPVSFAVRDKPSIVLGALLTIAFLGAAQL